MQQTGLPTQRHRIRRQHVARSPFGRKVTRQIDDDGDDSLVPPEDKIENEDGAEEENEE